MNELHPYRRFLKIPSLVNQQAWDSAHRPLVYFSIYTCIYVYFYIYVCLCLYLYTVCIQHAKSGGREIFEQKTSCLKKSRWNLPLPHFCAKPDNLFLTWEQFPSRSHNVSVATAVKLKSKQRLLRHLLGNDFLVWVCVLLWQLSYLCLKTCLWRGAHLFLSG